MWDIPWMIGGGVAHTVETARLLAYVAAGGVEGIVGAPDIEVSAQATPNGTVKVWPGACVIIDRAPDNPYQAYAARHLLAENLAISPTAGAQRSDLIVARIQNPYFTGSPWPEPDAGDPVAKQEYDYASAVVISGVSANTKTITGLGLGYSAIPLARIDLPPGTTNVLPEHITDLRRMTKIQRDEQGHIVSPEAVETLSSSSYTIWPNDATLDVYVPEWATHVDLEATLSGIKYGATGDNSGNGWNVVGDLRLVLGHNTANEKFSNALLYNQEVEDGKDRATLIAGESNIKVPKPLRGVTSTVKVQGKKNLGTTELSATPASVLMVKATFKALPESNT